MLPRVIRIPVPGLQGPAGDEITRTVVSPGTIPAIYMSVLVSGYYAPGDGGAARYVRKGSEPSHPGKLQSDDGAWWEIAESVIHAKMVGCKIDYVFDGDVAAATDDTEAVNNWFETLQVLHRPGVWEGLIVITAPLDPITRAISIDGHDKAISGFILRGNFSDFAITQRDTFGLWDATINPNTTPPPGSTYKSFNYRNFTVWGAGESYTQLGLVFLGRCDQICMEHVEFVNINGMALYGGKGYSGASNKGYVGESYFADVRAYRCGRDEAFTVNGATFWHPAILFECAGVSAGLNQNGFFDMDVSLPRGDGLVIYASGSQSNRNEFFRLKLHGTGESGVFPAPYTRELLTLVGRINNLSIHGLDLNGQGAAYYAVNFRKHPTSGNPLDIPNSVYIQASHIVSANVFNVEQGLDIKFLMQLMTSTGTTLKVGPDVGAGYIEYHQLSGQQPVLNIDVLATNVNDYFARWDTLPIGGKRIRVDGSYIRYFPGDTPEGVLVGNPGDIVLCQKADAALNSDNLWVKHTGLGINTGWRPLQMILFGAKTQRPSAPTPYQMFFDTTLIKPVWYKTAGGAGWVDSTGAAA